MNYRWDEIQIAKFPLLMNHTAYSITLYGFFKLLCLSLGLIALSFYYSDTRQFYDLLFYWIEQPLSHLFIVLTLSKMFIYDRLWRKYLIDNDCLTLDLRQKAVDDREDDLSFDSELTSAFCGLCLWCGFIFIVNEILLCFQLAIKIPFCFIFAMFLSFAISSSWYYICRHYYLYRFIKDIKVAMAKDKANNYKDLS